MMDASLICSHKSNSCSWVQPEHLAMLAQRRAFALTARYICQVHMPGTYARYTCMHEQERSGVKLVFGGHNDAQSSTLGNYQQVPINQLGR